MNKGMAIVWTIGATIILYLIMLIAIPLLNTFAISANATIVAQGSNVSNYPGAVPVLLAAPWWLWWAPGALCMIVIVGILRHKG